MQAEEQKRPTYPALRVNQWLPTWDAVEYLENSPRRKPQPYFYVLSLPAKVLRRLSGVERRTTGRRLEGGQDLNIQRKLDPVRVEEIASFVESGFPWSELSEAKRRDSEFADLRMPGWLPTAIVINVKAANDVRDSGVVAPRDLLTIEASGNDSYRMILPESYDDETWQPQGSLPIEVIDGQHRLYAFDTAIADAFELPVVAFFSLDISWQAYLFYVINIKPKRINPSLAYDLYPLLRNAEWLNKLEGHVIYRDTRSQELTQIMWSYPGSPWHRRINMLGGVGEDAEGQVNQASWVRNLTNAMVKRAVGPRIGGLFGGDSGGSVPWTRTEQAAFLIFAWGEIQRAVQQSNQVWVTTLRAHADANNQLHDPAFSGKLSLLNTDQGVRGVLHILNDMLMIRRIPLKLDQFTSGTPIGDPSNEDLSAAVVAFRTHPELSSYVESIANGLASFDWRTSDAPGLTAEERTIRKTFRGSGGYRELRRRLLLHLATGGPDIRTAATEVSLLLGYDEAE